MKLKGDAKLIVAGVVVLAAGAWYLRRQAATAAGAVGDAVQGAWNSAVSTAQTPWLQNIGVGAVEYAGLAVGIPRTDASECARLKAAGDWWGASFACPAGEFISSGFDNIFGSTKVQAAQQADARRIDNAIDAEYFARTGDDSRYLL